MKPFETLEHVRRSHGTVHQIIRSGGNVADCVVALANLNEKLIARLMELELIAPKRVSTLDGKVWIYRCPDELVPECGDTTLGDSLCWLPMESAPRDGTEILVLFDSATVDVVRLCWWDDGAPRESDNVPAPRPDDVGWWSYRHSVTQEKIEIMDPVGWFPMPAKQEGR